MNLPSGENKGGGPENLYASLKSMPQDPFPCCRVTWQGLNFLNVHTCIPATHPIQNPQVEPRGEHIDPLYIPLYILLLKAYT